MRVKRFVIVRDERTAACPTVIKPHLTFDERQQLYAKFARAIDLLYPNEPFLE